MPDVPTFLQKTIPEDNVVDLMFAKGTPAQMTSLEALYDPATKLILCFSADDEESPDWARKAGKYLDDQFTSPDNGEGPHTKLFGDVIPKLYDDGAGKVNMNCRHALEFWKEHNQGLAPYKKSQGYGSCVDASCAEHEDALFGYRAAHPEFLRERNQKREIWKYSAAWYKYANRGYCSDGWNGSGCASVAYKIGAAFTIKYEVGGNSVSFEDENKNERIVAREWCRRGVPDWLAEYTQEHHAYEDGAITRFQGGRSELRRLFANGGVIHTSGRRTSGGSKPFSIGSVGPHMQSGVGCDDSDDFRRFCESTIGVRPRDDDFPVVMNQTWGGGWRGECADRYWPFGTDLEGKIWSWYDFKNAMASGRLSFSMLSMFDDGWGWGPKPEGAWVWWASDVLNRLSCDYGWLPWVTGFPTDDPVPPPPGDHPPIHDFLYIEDDIVEGEVRLELPDKMYKYVCIPQQDPENPNRKSFALKAKPDL